MVTPYESTTPVPVRQSADGTGFHFNKINIEVHQSLTAPVSSSLLSDVDPPDPIPNSEVKRVSADNTCFARYREDRSRLGDFGAVLV